MPAADIEKKRACILNSFYSALTPTYASNPTSKDMIAAVDLLQPLVPKGCRILLQTNKTWLHEKDYCPLPQKKPDIVENLFRLDDGVAACGCVRFKGVSDCQEPFFETCDERTFLTNSTDIDHEIGWEIIVKRSHLRLSAFQGELHNLLNESALFPVLYALCGLNKEVPIYSYVGQNDRGYLQSIEMYEWLFSTENSANLDDQYHISHIDNLE
jgi:hypothetical protein